MEKRKRVRRILPRWIPMRRFLIRWILAECLCAPILFGCGGQRPREGMTETQADRTAEVQAERATEPQADRTTEPSESISESTAADTESAAQPSGTLSEPAADLLPEQSAQPLPLLPSTGQSLSDFIAKDWELIDSVELDYNGDGITDYVGVQEAGPDISDSGPDSLPPARLLFAIASDGPGQYRLDFQEENLIRTRAEGGVFGDPYQPLTAEGNSFTTHAFGGSAWKWTEDYTYTWREGTWYLTRATEEYGYGPYPTEYTQNDWDSGIRTCRRRSEDFTDMEAHWGEHEGLEDDGIYDIEYEMRLDEPLTIYQAGKRWWLAPDRVTDWKIKTLVTAEGIGLAPEAVKTPTQGSLCHYCDENCMLYTFSVQEPDGQWYSYLAMYCWQDQSLHVLAKGNEAGASLEEIGVYADRIYYSEEVTARVAYEAVQEEKTVTVEDDCVIGMRLNRIGKDGTGKETVFEYLYPGTDQPLLAKKPPYMGLIVDISGDEAVIEVYIGSREPNPVYRMELDGSRLRQIGQLPQS